MLMFRGRKGFTLIEMMIVIAIIALLATIAIPNYINFQNRAKQAEAKTNLGAIRTCEEAYRAEEDVYVNCTKYPATEPTAATLWVGNDEFNAIGFEAKGQVRYSYAVVDASGSAFNGTANSGVTALEDYYMTQAGVLETQ